MVKKANAGNKVRRAAVKGLVFFFLIMAGFTFLSRITASLTVPRVVTQEPVYGSLEHKVTAVGTLSARQEIAVVTEPDLLIQTVCVAVGERVEEGDVIAVLDMERLREKMELLEEEIAADAQSRQDEARDRATAEKRAKEDYETISAQTEEAVKSAKRLLEEAEAAYGTYQGMLGTREITEEEYRQSISLLEDKKAKEEAYRQALQNQETAVRDAKRAIEDAERAESRTSANSSAAQAQLARYQELEETNGEVRAPAVGIVTELYGQVGQKTTDTAFLRLADAGGGLCFTAFVSKEDAAHLELGAEVTIKKNKEEVEGLTVKTMKTEEDGSVIVTVDVAGTDWVPGESAEFCAVTPSAGSGMTVPLTALHTENGKNYVFVMQSTNTVLGEEQQAVRVDVTVKEKNSSTALLETEALSTSSQIITDCDRPIADGSKVRLWER